MPTPTIIETMTDRKLFGRLFQPIEHWAAWQTVLKALFGLPLTEEERTLFQAKTGRQTAPETPTKEAWLVVGRRGGKSRIAAAVAVYLACFRDYKPLLAPGERGTVMVIAQDRKQARVVFRYITGLLESVPLLASLLESPPTVEGIHLTNRISIEIHTASFRAVRGYTIVAAICDEVAFWRDEGSANPDTEIIAALRPGMSTIPSALLLAISSPYARRGALWEAHKAHYGNEGDPVLVWQADTRSMNQTVAAAVIQAAYEADEAAAAAEYGALFRRDIESYITRESLDAVLIPGRRELPPVGGCRYFAFVDPSGGSADSMTLAVAHREDGTAILDLVRERKPPFSPEQVVGEFTECLKSYRITAVTGDRYAGEWPREQFRKAGIKYEISEQVRSDLYLTLLPLINSGKVQLLDHSKLVAQLAGLERKTARGGRDTIDHGPHCHDDLANAAAGALGLAAHAREALQIYLV